MSMFHIKFEYRDRYSGNRLVTQECYVESVKACKEFYGLGIDCDYRIISVEKV